jgi:broad specificity phosphatase PhoE
MKSPDLAVRHCNKCSTTKPTEDFYPSVKTRCRTCCKAAAEPKRAEIIERVRRWREANPNRHKEWYAQHRAERSAAFKKWRADKREHLAASYRKWAAENKHMVRALSAKRNAAKKRATVAWADQNAIRAIYAQAVEQTARTGERIEVDHIIPLQGRNVCGLHWEGNLQLLPKTENIRKSNRLMEPSQ